jgi:toxin ParE1/3/4
VARVEVHWTEGAVRDLESAHAFIAEDSPRYADLVAARLVAAVDRVREFPESGRVVPELGRPDVREVLHGAYRILYLLRGDRAEVLAVHHGARRFPELRLEG